MEKMRHQSPESHSWDAAADLIQSIRPDDAQALEIPGAAGVFPDQATRAKVSTSTRFAFARSRARDAALRVAPEVITSSTSTIARPSTRADLSSRTSNAPCTLIARWERVSRTCERVAFTLARQKGSTEIPLAAEIDQASASA